MRNVSALVFCVVLGLAFVGKVQAADVFAPDKVHSTLGFSIAHMMVSKTTGVFTDYDGSIKFDPKDLVNSSIDFTIRAASIDTRNEMRDNHLRGADFLDAGTYPVITFKSKAIKAGEDNNYAVSGDLTMKNVTKEVTLIVAISGPVKNPVGEGQVLGLEAHFKINRQDYGVNWNKALDNGGVMVGDMVEVNVQIEAHK